MARKPPALSQKDDGRLYSRVTRRCVAILKHTRLRRQFTLLDLAREIEDAEYPDFEYRRDERIRQIQASRIRDYVSYLVDLRIFTAFRKKYRFDASFVKPTSDGHWAQRLSDKAREHLARLLELKTQDLPGRLEEMRLNIHSKGRVPTVTAVIEQAGIEGERKKEVVRWSVYLYTDGDASPLDIRRFPHLAPK